MKSKNKKAKSLFTKSRLIVASLSVAAVGSVFAYRALAARTIDLSELYPNTNRYQSHYLEGNNYVSGQPSRAVIWFERLNKSDNTKHEYKMYNSAPEDKNAKCHWDHLSWQDGYLLYSQTHNDCGSANNDIVYSPAIKFLPKKWQYKSPWEISGSVKATYKENGKTVCTGTNTYKGVVIGMEKITPDESALHWRTNQVTKWTWNKAGYTGTCQKGATTRWQEDYWLSNKIPAATQPNQKNSEREYGGLRRTQGGNLDTSKARDWDIWFDMWTPLPSKKQR